MLMASMPIAVLMQRRSIDSRWVSEVWSALGVVVDRGDLAPVQPLTSTPEQETYLVSGLTLQLFPDEDDGYFENCIAPQPKVFVKWRMEDGRAMPLMASVSYAEGTRMFDSGDPADGVDMPDDIHAWLTEYLREHYKPRSKRRGHKA